MARRRRRVKRANVLKWLVLILGVVIVVPILFGPVLRLPFVSQTGVPMVLVWREDQGQVLEMDLEEYVKGVVAAEMPASFDLEALKAQAVAARTYAYRRISRDERIADHPQAHLSTDFRSGQAWVSWDTLARRWGLVDFFVYRRKITKAVQDTEGVVALYDGEPILAVYHSTSGGRTENSEHYWSTPLPYLRGVSDPYGDHSPYVHTTKTLSTSAFAAQMETRDVSNTRIVSRYPSGRVETMEVGDTWFSGREVRKRLGLRSTWFTVEVRADTVEFSVWGYGHGVGMSQYGADGMARLGYDYREILQYYYQGIVLDRQY